MKTLTALILAVFVCVLGHFFSKWCGVSYGKVLVPAEYELCQLCGGHLEQELVKKSREYKEASK